MNKKIAAIDIGTNSFHLIVVEVLAGGNFEIVDREKEVIRLNEGSKGDIKIITEEAMVRAISAIKKFAGIAKAHNAEIKAVATSAVRESQNKIDFIQRVAEETKINIEVISGVEEGRLIYTGILRAVPVFNKKVLCIDIGGGSTEFVVGYKGKILYANSLKLGAVRLTKMFFPDFKITQDRMNKCKRWVEGEIFPLTKTLKNFTIDIVVGSSGTIMASGLMIKALAEKNTSPIILNNFKFSKSELSDIEKKILAGKTVESRKKIKGLDEKRADIIPAGIILLSTIFNECNFDEMTISGYALREGIIFDQIEKNFSKGKGLLKTNIRNESAEKLAKSCNYDLKHCRHVESLAGKLFDELKELHKLPQCYKEYLQIASRLHDIGYHISHSKHHKHSQYIIVNSELLGFNENEIRTIACVARYHRKSHPKSSHEEFMLLPKEWRTTVRKLSAILRIADALDRTHNSLVRNIFIVNSKSKICLYVENDLSEIDIELWSINRRKQLFKETFNKEIEIQTVTEN